MITRTKPDVHDLVKNISWYLSDYDDDKMGYAEISYKMLDGILTLEFDADEMNDDSFDYEGADLTGWKSVSYRFQLIQGES